MSPIEIISLSVAAVVALGGLWRATKADANTTQSGILDWYKSAFASLQEDNKVFREDAVERRKEAKEFRMEINKLEKAFDACAAENAQLKIDNAQEKEENAQLRAEITRLNLKYGTTD